VRRTVASLALAVVTGLLAACAGSGPSGSDDPVAPLGVEPTGGTGGAVAPAGPSDGRQPPVRGGNAAGIQLVPPGRADLHLWVSNQSFADEVVGLTVNIDGVEVVARQFAVAGQHNWILFPVRLPPGRHEIRARSDTGAVSRQEFTMPAGERRYAVLDYWYHPGEEGRRITWRIQATPLTFD
jgi:hypothetical protein